jgi:hypothetical protein
MASAFVASLSLAVLPSAMAQEKPGTIAQVIVTRAKPGATKPYEEGRKRHMAWHNSQNDPWGWQTWQVTSGPDVGSYVTVAFGHHWKDFDTWEAKFAEGDNADVEKNLTPHTESAVVGYYNFLADLSRPASEATPARMTEVVHFLLKPGASGAFRHAISRAHEAITKTSWPVNYLWFELWNGGEGPHYVLVLPRRSWADMAEPETSFPAMLTKAFGPFEAGQILEAFDTATRSQSSEMHVYRPDLSYVPAQ